jgi:hypothetical protein
MQAYGVRDVERLLRLSRGTIRALVDAGFVTPSRGPRNAWVFSFQDLVVLRMAQALTQARVPRGRMVKSLREVRRRLPASLPLSGLSIAAVGDRVVVKEGTRRWQAESGQYLLGFEEDPQTGSLRVVEPPRRAPSAAEWFDKGVDTEHQSPCVAREAYEHAVALDPTFVDAWVNLGSLLHVGGKLADAEKAYRRALDRNGPEATLLYNLGVLLEDLDRADEALEVYEAALACDPDMPDCLYNLALLCERAGKMRDAIRHMATYRRLMARK